MMKLGIRGMLLGGILLLAGSVWAVPLPGFILYGDLAGQQSVSAYWNDTQIAKAELIEGHFKLVIPMDTNATYRSGDVVEVWVNGQPTGHMVRIGAVGSAQPIPLP